MDPSAKKTKRDALALVAQTVSTSYKEALSSAELKTILQTGEVPPRFQAHLIALLEEAPTYLVLRAIEEATTATITTDQMLEYLSKWALEWGTPNRFD